MFNHYTVTKLTIFKKFFLFKATVKLTKSSALEKVLTTLSISVLKGTSDAAEASNKPDQHQLQLLQ